MSNDLIDEADLAHLPGAPFTEEEVDEAVAALRGELGWHIAPVRGSEETPETITLDVAHCDPVLRLPTRQLVAVYEIRNADTDAVIATTTYRVSTPLARVRRNSSYWPAGFAAVEVDMSHGFAECPPELRPIIAQMIVDGRDGGGEVTKEALGSWSVSYSEGSTDTSQVQQETLARFSVRNSWPARL